ncbi:hypothetical protein IP84_03470 [beta proteobacterium AAP99]|nr:hypothetical protein IP84_03470 [beta proteobacterium AAP99]
MTTNPRSEFDSLAPASLFLIFKPKDPAGQYVALTVDAANEALIEYVSEVFGIRSDFHCRIFECSQLDLRPRLTELQSFVLEILAALDQGYERFLAFTKAFKRKSRTEVSDAAFRVWKIRTGETDLDPFRISAPGDAIFDITREIEFAIYRLDEAKTYGMQLVRSIFAGDSQIDSKRAVMACIENFDELYRVFLSASQARASRAGGSFETVVARTLNAGGIPFAAQNMFDGSKPDFVLPNASTYENDTLRGDHALILTLKTTLRERWKQVVSESKNCPIYLGTLDENITSATLDKLSDHSIFLVVPERFKASVYTEYANRESVISYRDFFDELRSRNMNSWLSMGIPCFGKTPMDNVT